MRWLASGGFQRFLAGFALGLAATLVLSTGGVHASVGSQPEVTQAEATAF